MHLTKYASGVLGFIAAAPSSLNLFTKGPAFMRFPDATFNITSPELGLSNSELGKDFTADGAGFFPALNWKNHLRGVREYVLVMEDETSSTGPILHGVYYGIPGVFSGLSNDDFQLENPGKGDYLLRGHFKYGLNRRKVQYVPPSPTPNQGPHRYHFQLVALVKGIDQGRLNTPATLEDIQREIQGKVMGWGEWIGWYERK
ncbi:hypothetical protein FE257_009672 [Aspergillus nanangensis]|uniref:PEBP-like protein n=1 Tax=Aspergillus nanangensis TaxID=2582783 RepID=A0AAD4CJJ4_ASPNN|nr:hypothetical protein FE257_009672 [Aspergillus nanangensis]